MPLRQFPRVVEPPMRRVAMPLADLSLDDPPVPGLDLDPFRPGPLPLPGPDPDLATPDTSGFPDGRGSAIAVIEGYVLSFDENDRAVVTDPDGRLLRTVPLKIRRSEEYQAIVRGRKDDRARGARARRALEERMISGESICAQDIAWLVEDDAFASHMRGLIVLPGGTAAVHNAGVLLSWDSARGLGLLPLDYDARWIGWTAIQILHPLELTDPSAWQDLLLDLTLEQPLPQAFREIRGIPLSEHHLTQSTLLSGRTTRSALAMERALFEEGWIPRRGNARRRLSVRTDCAAAMVTAWFDYGEFNAPTDPTRTGTLGFLRAPSREPIPLGAVPQVLLSEAIRSLEVCLAQAGTGRAHPRAAAGADRVAEPQTGALSSPPSGKTIFTSRRPR